MGFKTIEKYCRKSFKKLDDEILINPVTQFEQNCSLVICEQTNQSAFIDPGGDVDKLIEVLETSNSNLSKILITHGHIDHCGIASDLHKNFCTIIGPHQDDEFWIKQIPEQAKVFGFDELNSFVPDIWLNDNDIVKVGNIEFNVIHCPGHTPGHVVFYENLSKTAFVGDVIFAGSIGRTDFPRGNHEDLINSITNKLWPLGNEVKFVPGHGSMSSFGAERKSNPFVADHLF